MLIDSSELHHHGEHHLPLVVKENTILGRLRIVMKLKPKNLNT